MPRYAFRIEYHGGPFSGWQRQPALPSVQGAIEDALARLDPAHPVVTGAGRTDAGVHATGQVAHVDLGRSWDLFRLSEALNHHLRPHPIAITDIAEVGDEFHARFSATGRRYIFRILNRRAPLTLDKSRFWHLKCRLDADAMREGAAHLIGNHDFTTFRSTICQAKSPVKTLDSLEISEIPRPDGTEYRFDIRARSFLHNQVRSFIGTLARVGSGAWSPARVKQALNARDRTACGPVSPPHGLYLENVTYDPDPFTPGRESHSPSSL